MKTHQALQVVMKCEYCQNEAPVLIPTADGIPVQCGSCSRMAMVADAREHEAYRDSIRALIHEALNDAPLAIALSNAAAFSVKIQSPFSISIRASRAETHSKHAGNHA